MTKLSVVVDCLNDHYINRSPEAIATMMHCAVSDMNVKTHSTTKLQEMQQSVKYLIDHADPQTVKYACAHLITHTHLLNEKHTELLHYLNAVRIFADNDIPQKDKTIALAHPIHPNTHVADLFIKIDLALSEKIANTSQQ